MFSHIYPQSYTSFSSPHIFRSIATRISSLRLCHKENNCRPCSLFLLFRLDLRHLKLCDRVCTQSKKFYDGYPGIVRSGKMWARKWCIVFWVAMKKTWRISTYFRSKHHCGKEVRYFPCSVPKQKPRDYPP